MKYCTVVPLWKDPSQERPPLNKDHIFTTPKSSFTHKLPPLGRPPLHKVQFGWTSAAVFIEGKNPYNLNSHLAFREDIFLTYSGPPSIKTAANVQQIWSL